MNDIRKANLIQLIGDSTVAEFARTHDVSQQYLTLVLNDHRNIGEKFARKIEKNASLPPGYLDITTARQSPVKETVATRMITHELNFRSTPKHVTDTILLLLRSLPEKP